MTIMKKLASLLALVLLSSLSLAHAGEAEIKKGLANLLPPEAKIEQIRKLPNLPLYEVWAGNELIYTDANGKYAIFGQILDLKSKRNLTEERKSKLSQIKFGTLPLEQAIKQVRGNGKRVFATFEDPNCGYCKKLAHEIANMTDVTIYTFIIPILSADSAEKAKAIWCSADQVKAWNDYMRDNTAPSPGNCATPIEKNLALAQKLGIRGTPSIFLANGKRLPGFLPLPQLEQELNKAAK